MAGLKNPAYEAVTTDALDRIANCERHYKKVETWVDQVHSFTQPRKVRKESGLRASDSAELDQFTSIGMEVNNDFASDVLMAFTPEYAEWVDLEAGIAIPEQEKDTVNEAATELKKSVFADIRRSNFYTVAPQAYKDAGTTTGAFYVQDIHPALPVNVQHVPISELRIQVGPFGGVNDRFWVRKVLWQDAKALFHDSWEDVPKHFKDKAKEKRNGTVRVVHGGWRIWDDPAIERWQWVEMIEDYIVRSVILEGAGAMPLIVFRWDPDTESPWGTGPGFNALAEFRSLDDVNYNIIENIGRTVNPAVIYPDDGVINPRDGVEAGDWLPSRPGSAEDVKIVNTGARLDLGYLTAEYFTDTIRRLYFQDAPLQKGKTPPTATQWLDEAQRIQKRMGVPAAPVFTEGAAEVYLRFHRIGVERGQYAPIRLRDGDTVMMVPVNPVRRAQLQENVLLGTRLLEIIVQFFGPETVRLVVNTPGTIKKIKDALGDDLIELDDLNQADFLTKLQGLLQSAGVNAGQPEAIAA